MLAEEARAALRAAQAAHKAAEEAHCAAQMVLAGLEAALPPDMPVEAEQVPEVLHRDAVGRLGRRAATSYDVQTEDTPDVDPEKEPGPSAEIRLQPGESATSGQNSSAVKESSSAAKAQPLPANLIQFPREIVAARRLRARRAEGPLAEHDAAPQLSIFEVHPDAVSTLPAPATADDQAAPEWMRPGWSVADSDAARKEEPTEEPVAATAADPAAGLAPVSRRLMAVIVDGSLTMAAFLAVLVLATESGILLHNGRAFGIAAAFVFLLVCTGYQVVFAAFTRATPGMWYAGIGLCTLKGFVATREQRLRRLRLLPLSVLPLGLGLAWSLFDDNCLAWHDRRSGTYPRLR